MDEEKNTQQPVAEENNVPSEGTVFKEKESKVGPMIGSIIVILIIVVGGIYFLSTQVDEVKNQNNEQSEDGLPDTQQDIVDDVNQIDSELENLNLDDLDAELDAIDAEFEAI